jgi:hypothetical protein
MEGSQHGSDKHSSANATNGSDSRSTTTSTNKIEYIWDGGDIPSTPHDAKFPPIKHIRQRSKAVSEILEYRSAHNHDQEHILTPLTTTTARLILLVLLTLSSLTSSLFATYIFLQAQQGLASLKETKFVLLLATHSIAICAAASSVVLRRPLSEALLVFTAVMVCGAGIRSEIGYLL